MSNSNTPSYDFGEEMQRLVTAFVVRDVVFMNLTEGLVKPEYFDSDIHGFLINMIQEHWEKYSTIPDVRIIVDKILKAKNSNRIDEDMMRDVKTELKKIYKVVLSNRDYMVDEVARFAKYQAMSAAILDAAEKLDSGGDIDDIVPAVQEAADVGSGDDTSEYDYRGMIEARKHLREEEAAGNITRDGITTGHREFDRILYNRGWGAQRTHLVYGWT